MSKDIVVKVGEYEKGGEKKSQWLKVGVILSNEKGEYALLDPSVNLAGVMMKQRLMNGKGDSVMASIFDKAEGRTGGGNTPPPSDDFDDDIPF